VQSIRGSALASDVDMAILAACVRDAVNGGMAVAAILLEFGM